MSTCTLLSFSYTGLLYELSVHEKQALAPADQICIWLSSYSRTQSLGLASTPRHIESRHF